MGAPQGQQGNSGGQTPGAAGTAGGQGGGRPPGQTGGKQYVIPKWMPDLRHPYVVRDADLQQEAWRWLPAAWRQVDVAWSLSPVGSLTNFGLFRSFDTKYFSEENKEHIFRYMPDIGGVFPMIGREVNYYFEGLLFSAFRQPKETLRSFVYWWKRHYAVTNLWPTDLPKYGLSPYMPSINDYFMCLLGFDDQGWYLARRDTGTNAQMYAPIKRPQSMDAYWTEAQKLFAADSYYHNRE